MILLAQSRLGELPYVEIWCEQHEDFLCRRTDSRFDGWQIKTRTPEIGPWRLLDDGLVHSIGRFCDLVDTYREQIAELIFASNTQVDVVTSASHDDKRRGRCPQLFLDHVQGCDSVQSISPPFAQAFDDLQAETGAYPDDLLAVLQRVRLVQGPGRADFDAVLSHDHLAQLPEFGQLIPTQLAEARDTLIEMVAQACSLRVTDGARHVRSPAVEPENDPALLAKRLVVQEVFDRIVRVNGAGDFIIQRAPILARGEEHAPFAGEVLREKLKRGGLDEDQIEQFETLARSAEYHLIRAATRAPGEHPQFQADVESAVLGECREANLRAKQQGELFGEKMMIEVQDRLGALAADSPQAVWKQPKEFLLGVAALLTDECRVWFSPRFQLEGGSAEAPSI